MRENEQRVIDSQKMMWSLGKYDRAAEFLRPAAAGLLRACGVSSGDRFLDVGAGTGNVAIEAATAGASVIATDITPHLMDAGRERTSGLDVTWKEADAQNLPFPDDTFDAVGSAFGAMFAPDADAAVREMMRVVKPGGVVAMTAWAQDGFTAATMEVSGKYLPPPPEGVNTAGEWGDEETARSRFAKHLNDVRVERATTTWNFDSMEDAEDFFRNEAPPSQAAQMVLSPEKYEEMVEEMRPVQERFNKATDGRVALESEYLLVVGRKAG